MNYKMTVYPAIEAGMNNIVFIFETVDQMLVSKDVSADLIWFIQDKMQVMNDYSNMFLLEENIDGEWIEYDQF